MDDLIKEISKADHAMLSEIVQAVIKRYGILHTDWEILFLSLPKYDCKERERILSDVFKILTKYDSARAWKGCPMKSDLQ
jgi:hypothetical protein